MTYRSRLVMVSSAAVALAIVLASGVLFVVTRSELRGEVDRALASRVGNLHFRSGISEQGFPLVIPQAPLGGAGGYVQVLSTAGSVTLAPGEHWPLPVSEQAEEVASGKREGFFSDAQVAGTHVRVLTAPLADGLAVQLARSLAEVDSALRRLGVFLVIATAAGIGLAAVLGSLVAQATLAPVRRLTEVTEDVTATGDLTRRIELAGSDELSRLAGSFDTMMGALDASLSAQRQLVADASHELRTPITSIRTNIEVLQRNPGLSGQEREQLLGDVVGQLEELTVLVGDMVELARGREPGVGAEDVRLDQVVSQVVQRAEKLAPNVRFATRLEPVVVRAAPSRLERAVRNLLDNAAKWSPPGGVVEVSVNGGEVMVRDHGPGIDQSDLPFVFDRFYRAAGARGLPGSGLGLALVRQVAEGHGGSVSAENAEGGGALLRLRLPVLDDRGSSPSLPDA